jgi:MoaF N-terminal domain
MTIVTPAPRATDSWDVIPLAEQFRNHDEFRPEPTAELAGVSLSLHFADHLRVEVEIDSPTSLRWRTTSSTAWGSTGAEHYEAACVRDGIYAATVARLAENTSALIFVDRPGARALVNVTSFAQVDGTMTERTSVFQAGSDRP